MRELIEHKAAPARSAAPLLRDEGVSAALIEATALLWERRAQVLDANHADVQAAAGTFDEGTLNRLRLDVARLEALATQVAATAELEPLERVIGSRTRANGLVVQERRIAIGTVGANFEARPDVALDVPGQLMQSGASLLGVGAVSCEGAFKAGDAAELLGPERKAFAKGIVSVPAHDAATRGAETVHRDRLVIL